MKKMNLPLAFFLAFYFVHKVKTAAIAAPLDIISYKDLSKSERQQIAALNAKYERPKRSEPNYDPISAIKYLLGQGVKAKIGLLGKASSYAASAITGEKGYKSYKGYPSGYPPGYPEPPYPIESGKGDPWSMKKAVLNTLFQAVKAIKGGVLAIKGQLIKGGGYLLVGGGKLVSAKGEVITTLGKNIAKNAFKSVHADHSSEVHEEGSYGHYSPSGAAYGVIPGPGPDSFHHLDYQSYPDKPAGAQSGILILKKIPSSRQEPYPLHASSADLPAFKRVEPEPTFATIMGKFLSAATSLNPESPAPFGDFHKFPSPSFGASEEHPDDRSQQEQGNFPQPLHAGVISLNHGAKTTENIQDDSPAPQAGLSSYANYQRLPPQLGQDFTPPNPQAVSIYPFAGAFNGGRNFIDQSQRPAQNTQQGDNFGNFEPPPRYLDHGELMSGVANYQNYAVKKLSIEGMESPKPQADNVYENYRGTPTVNAQMVNPGSNLDLPQFERYRRGYRSPITKGSPRRPQRHSGYPSMLRKSGASPKSGRLPRGVGDTGDPATNDENSETEIVEIGAEVEAET